MTVIDIINRHLKINTSKEGQVHDINYGTIYQKIQCHQAGQTRYQRDLVGGTPFFHASADPRKAVPAAALTVIL